LAGYPIQTLALYTARFSSNSHLKWLQEEYGCEVVTFTADIGQDEDMEPARAKAEAAGIRETYIEDPREEFVRDFAFPMFRANAVYEGEYLLGTSIARPLIAKRLIEIAAETSADAVSHGATGKGNVMVVGRKSESNSLFDESIATFEEDAGAYDQGDATGFIRLNALRLRVAGRKRN
jgi:argininosuccinate synthase